MPVRLGHYSVTFNFEQLVIFLNHQNHIKQPTCILIQGEKMIYFLN